MKIYQGSTYKLPIKIKRGGKIITDADVKKVELAIGGVIKTYPDDATFEGEQFIFPLSQEDTFKMTAKGSAQYQARVVFNDDSVKPTEVKSLGVIASISKEVL